MKKVIQNSKLKGWTLWSHSHWEPRWCLNNKKTSQLFPSKAVFSTIDKLASCHISLVEHQWHQWICPLAVQRNRNKQDILLCSECHSFPVQPRCYNLILNSIDVHCACKYHCSVRVYQVSLLFDAMSHGETCEKNEEHPWWPIWTLVNLMGLNITKSKLEDISGLTMDFSLVDSLIIWKTDWYTGNTIL